MSETPLDRCKVPPALWRAIERLGMSPAAVLRQARLPATLHVSDNSLISTAQFFALWKALEDLTGDPGLGIRLVTGADTAAHPPSSLAAFYARNYRDGLERTARFKRLCTPEQLRFKENEGEFAISVEWLYSTEPEPAIATDVAFSTFVELGRRGTGQHITPIRVDLMRPNTHVGVHEGYFGCPIRYSSAQNVLILKSIDLDRPFPGHNPELLEILTPALASAVAELQSRSSIAEQVKIVLKRNLASGRPDLSDVARDLGMSDRTLQRRITDEGTTFRELLLSARKELGHQLLSDASADVSEVAYLLGYQDLSSFYRAFREWEGITPSQWRELNADGSEGGRDRVVH